MVDEKHRTDEDVEVALLQAEIAARAADMGLEPQDRADQALHRLADAMGDDLSANANPYVPWSDPQIPYHCSCGEIIYADTPHVHAGDD